MSGQPRLEGDAGQGQRSGGGHDDAVPLIQFRLRQLPHSPKRERRNTCPFNNLSSSRTSSAPPTPQQGENAFLEFVLPAVSPGSEHAASHRRDGNEKKLGRRLSLPNLGTLDTQPQAWKWKLLAKCDKGVQAWIEEVRSKYMLMDTNGNGVLDYNELRRGLRQQDPTVNESQLRTLFASIDKNHDGKINIEEFLNLVSSMKLAAATRAAPRRARNADALVMWEGPEICAVTGQWDKDTKRALQRFLLAQNGPTVRLMGERFVSGIFSTRAILVLQEFLSDAGIPHAVAKGVTFITGEFDASTNRALHEFLLRLRAPSAVLIGEKFSERPFGRISVCAIQEFLTMYRKTAA